MTKALWVSTVGDMSIRCAIVNDYEVIVRGVAGMLTMAPDIEVVELDSGTSVAQSVDIALYDTFAQPPNDGPGIAELVDNPMVDKVVLYSWYTQRRHVEAARDQGVVGYLSKALAGAQLAEALTSIHSGEVVLPHSEDGDHGTGGDWPGRREGLAPREAEMIAFITQGLSNREIAAATGLSPNSVKTYVRAAYRKMGVSSRANAVLWGLEHGFFPDRLRIKDPENA